MSASETLSCDRVEVAPGDLTAAGMLWVRAETRGVPAVPSPPRAPEIAVPQTPGDQGDGGPSSIPTPSWRRQQAGRQGDA